MSVLHPSRITRRLIKIASLGLAGLLAGLLTGCTSGSGHLLQSRNDTDWQTTSTYASATATFPQQNAARSTRTHPCFVAPCGPHMQSAHTRSLHHL